jgi:hypothetical protein
MDDGPVSLHYGPEELALVALLNAMEMRRLRWVALHRGAVAVVVPIVRHWQPWIPAALVTVTWFVIAGCALMVVVYGALEYRCRRDMRTDRPARIAVHARGGPRPPARC